MAFILQSIETQLSDLLWQIAEDYGLDHGELCERYLGCEVPPKKAAKAKVSSDGAKKCCGKTAKGLPCKKNAVGGSDYCNTHKPSHESEGEAEVESDGPKMCCGKTAKGQKCKKKASSGSDYCKTHEPKMNELDYEEEEETEMCKAVTGKKQPCKKKAVCDGFCKTHSKGPFKLKEPVHTHEPGEEDENCDSCSLYGDPVNGSKTRIEIIEDEEVEKAPRRSERIRLTKLLEQVETEPVGEDDEEDAEDLMSFAEALEKQMAEEDF